MQANHTVTAILGLALLTAGLPLVGSAGIEAPEDPEQTPGPEVLDPLSASEPMASADQALQRLQVTLGLQGRIGDRVDADSTPSVLDWQRERLQTARVLAGDEPGVLGGTAGELSRLVHAVAQRHGVGVDASSEREVESLASLDPAVQDALAEVLASYLDLAEASQAAFGGASTEAIQEARRLAAPGLGSPQRDAEPIQPQLSPVLEEQRQLTTAALQLEAALDDGPEQDRTIDLCPALSIDLAERSQNYREGCALIVDAGGDDAYTNNAGGNNLAAGKCVLVDPRDHVWAGSLVDLGGDDVYGQSQGAGDCGVNGGGWAGAGLLVDTGGQDVYVANGTGVNGAGFYGTGLLVDGGGDDGYLAGSLATNGGGVAGTGLLYDDGGNDTYRAGSLGTNGGSLQGAGLLVDGGGADHYDARARGTNGGTMLGVASLVDAGEADDRYEATSTAVNGQGLTSRVGVDLGFGSVAVSVTPSPTVALLLDGGGRDRFEDHEGGAGIDESVVLKGVVGAQVDLPHVFGDPHRRNLDQDASNARPHVTVGLIEDGINPYHEQFYRPNLTEHPCTYIPNYPCDVPALNLTLDAPSIEAAIEADEEVLESVEPGQWYWIPQTVFVAVACDHGEDRCILGGPEGTVAASSVLSENSGALIAAKNGDTSLDLFRDGGLPVDLYSTTKAHNVGVHPAPAGACDVRHEHEAAPLLVKNTARRASSGLTDCWDGLPGVIDVAGGFTKNRSNSLSSGAQPDLASYYCRPYAHPVQQQGTIHPDGAQCAGVYNAYLYSIPDGGMQAPTAAGAISEVILSVREASGYTGNVTGDLVDPRADLTIGELTDAVNRTASYEPPVQYDTEAPSLNSQVPVNPVAPWLQWGWGFYDGWVANATEALLVEGESVVDKPLPARTYMQGQATAEQAFYGSPR